MVYHLHDRVIQIGGVTTDDAFCAKGFGQFYEIRQALRP